MSNHKALQAFLNNNLQRIKADDALRDKPWNHGSIWTTNEERNITQLFEQGVSVQTIAKNLGRTPFAIECRLVKLGLLDENGCRIQKEEWLKSVNTKQVKNWGYAFKENLRTEALGTLELPLCVGYLDGPHGFTEQLYSYEQHTKTQGGPCYYKDKIIAAAKAKGVWILDGDGNLWGGPKEEVKMTYPNCIESEVKERLGYMPKEADGSYEKPFCKNYLNICFPGYPLYNSQDFDATIEYCKKEGYWLIDGNFRYYGGDKKIKPATLEMKKKQQTGSKEFPFCLGNLKPYITDYIHHSNDWALNLKTGLKCLEGTGKYIIDGNGDLHQATKSWEPPNPVADKLARMCTNCGKRWGEHKGENCPDNKGLFTMEHQQPKDYNVKCAECGERYGDHSGSDPPKCPDGTGGWAKTRFTTTPQIKPYNPPPYSAKPSAKTPVTGSRKRKLLLI